MRGKTTRRSTKYLLELWLIGIYRHTFWFRAIEWIVAVTFFGLCIFAVPKIRYFMTNMGETELEKRVDTLTNSVKDNNKTNQTLQRQLTDLNAQVKQEATDRVLLQKQLKTLHLLIKTLPAHTH